MGNCVYSRKSTPWRLRVISYKCTIGTDDGARSKRDHPTSNSENLLSAEVDTGDFVLLIEVHPDIHLA